MLKKYFIENKKIASTFLYLVVIFGTFVLNLISTVIKEDLEIKNQSLPWILEIINYTNLLIFYCGLHLFITIYIFKINKNISVISGIISLFFLYLLVYPIIFIR